MIRKSASPLLELIRGAGLDPGVGELPDDELLARFSRGGERGSLPGSAATTRADGTRRLPGVLANEADAKMFLQGRFLVLAPRFAQSGSAASPSAAGCTGWPTGHLSKRVRRFSIAATTRPAQKDRYHKQTTLAGEVQEVLHAELSRCSDCFQARFVLCYLEGKTPGGSGCPARCISRATVKKRLERGRALLRARLRRRGLTSAAVLALSAWPGAASACLPPELEVATLKAVAASLTGSTAATGAISARVATLTNGVLKTMWMTRCGMAAAVVLVGLLATGLGGLAYQRLSAGPGEDRKDAQAAGKTRPEDEQEKQARANLDLAEANLKQAEAAVQAARATLEIARAR